MNFNRAKFKNKPKQHEPKRKQTKKVQDGITFDSPLELFTYNLLRENGINFELKKKYELVPSFSYGGKTVIGASLTIDFYLPDHDIILDPKGFMQGATDLKWKLLKHHLFLQGLDPRICFVYSQKSAKEFIHQLRNGFTEEIEPRFINGRITRLKKQFKRIGDDFIRWDGILVCTASDLATMPDYDLYKLIKNNQPPF
ncbi:MAG TPA: DUF1064 domain-containing protein [Bacteroidia bacterium]|nr:DUF1064 domain-containing protein [Bacteroidia bacterium]